MTEPLKPCPFCGEVRAVAEVGRYRCDDDHYFVRCHGCLIETARYTTKREPIAAWNRRALSAAPGAERDRLSTDYPSSSSSEVG